MNTYVGLAAFLFAMASQYKADHFWQGTLDQKGSGRQAEAAGKSKKVAKAGQSLMRIGLRLHLPVGPWLNLPSKHISLSFPSSSTKLIAAYNAHVQYSRCGLTIHATPTKLLREKPKKCLYENTKHFGDSF